MRTTRSEHGCAGVISVYYRTISPYELVNKNTTKVEEYIKKLNAGRALSEACEMSFRQPYAQAWEQEGAKVTA